MSSNPNNPFLDLTIGGSSRQERVTGGGNPFTDLRIDPQDVGPALRRGEDIPLTEIFLAGTKQGLKSPFRIFGVNPEVELEQDLTTGEDLVKLAGELAGEGISFIPFFLATRGTLGGLGLTQKLPSNIAKLVRGSTALLGTPSRAGVAAARGAEGAISFGLFEAGRQEELEEVPEAFATGAAIGAGFEVALMGLARHVRGRFPEWEPEFFREIRLHPDAMNLEFAMRPNSADDLDRVTLKLAMIGDETAQLEDVIARVAGEDIPGGMAILEGVENPAQVKQALGRHMADDRILVTDADEDGLRRVFFSNEEDSKRLVELFAERLEAGGDRPPIEEFVDMILGPEAAGITTQVNFVPKVAGSSTTLGQARGTGEIYVLEAPAMEKAIKTLGGGKEASVKQYETLVHEYMHHITAAFTEGELVTEGGGFFNLGFVNRPIKEFFENTIDESVDVITNHAVVLPENLTGLSAEFRDATYEVLTQFFEGAQGRAKAERFARQLVDEDWGYFGQDNELLSRLAELMLSDPKKAREIAPNATRLMSRVFEEKAPVMRRVLLSKPMKELNDLVSALWVAESGQARFFRELPVRITRKQQQQFTKEGAFGGMGVLHEGQWWEYGRALGEGRAGRVSPDTKIRLRNPRTGETKVVPRQDIQLPTFQRVMARNAEVRARIKSEAAKPLDNLTLRMDFPEDGGVRTVNVKMSEIERTPSLSQWISENEEVIFTPEVRQAMAEARREVNLTQYVRDTETGELVQITFAPEQTPVAIRNARIAEVLRARGQSGLAIMGDGPVPKIFVADQRAVSVGSELMSRDFAGFSDGVFRSADDWQLLQPSLESFVTSKMSQAGIRDKEADLFKSLFEEEIASQLTDLVDNEFTRAFESAMSAGEDLPEDLKTFASRIGARVDDSYNGEFRMTTEDGVEILRTSDPDAPASYISRAGVNETDDLARGAEISTEVTPANRGGSQQIDFQAQPNTQSEGLSRIVDAVNFLTARFTAMENVARSIEKLGIGPAFRKVFDPGQRAIEAVKREMETIARDAMGGRTFSKQLEQIEKLAQGLPVERQHKIIDYIEFLTKDEVARAGGFMQRGMTQNEIRVARQIEQMGIAHQMPRLMALDRHIRNFVKNQTDFVNNTAPRVLEDPNVGEPFKQRIRQLLQQTEEIKTAEDAMAALGLTTEERWGIKVINDSKAANKDDFSINAVIRYATAPEKEGGFATGREMFAAQNGLTSRDLEIAELIDQANQAAFEISGLDAKRQIGGYFPHIRQMMRHGIVPDNEFVKREMPDFLEWAGQRYRTGELDVYLKDPVLSTYKNIRSMLMKKHFDPVLPQIKEGLAQIKQTDHRAWRIMTEYVEELQGRPHVSFKKVNEWISSFTRSLGYDVGEDFVQDVVNTFTTLAYGATIPFRPALIIRNYFEGFQKLGPRVGFGDYLAGLRKAMTDDGFNAARRGGAIQPNVNPLHATTEVFDEALGQGLLKGANRRLQQLTRKGFDWYRGADEFSRATAYHAIRHRIRRIEPQWRRGDISWEQFMERAKVRTFDELDQLEFERLFQAGQEDQAIDLLGRSLSREAINRYGNANHPFGWGSIYGRLFGQFGTWPVQYKDFVLQGLTRGTAKDKMEFLLGHAATNMGVVALGAAGGFNLWSWVMWPSLAYTGGPAADIAVDLYQSFGGSPAERAMARRNLTYLFPTLENPESVFVPGSYLIGDIAEGMRANTIGEGIAGAAGFRMLRPGEEFSGFEYVTGLRD